MSSARSVSIRRGVFLLWAWGTSLSACSQGTPEADGSDAPLATGGAPSGGQPGELGGAGAEPGSTGGSVSSPSGGGPPEEVDGGDGERVEVDGGAFPMGRSETGGDACPSDQACAPGEGPEHAVTVSPFWLDRFEVTVKRFRAFYERYPLPLPAEGSGAHPKIPGSGWQADFAIDLPESQATLLEQLACDDDAAFTASSDAHDALPINCVSWPLAFLFCTEVGGRLPTEAEWEFAAAGGDENRSYPWGNETPDATHASFFPSELGATGQHPAGRGRYGHEDLAGSVWEWTLDWLDTNWYADGGATCTDCARVSSGTHRALRGGAYGYDPITLRAAARSGDLPASRQAYIGFRCAYDRAEP